MANQPPHIPGFPIPADLQRVLLPGQTGGKAEGLRKGLPDAQDGTPLGGGAIMDAIRSGKIGMLDLDGNKVPPDQLR
jgi:hypothetical protein